MPDDQLPPELAPKPLDEYIVACAKRNLDVFERREGSESYADYCSPCWIFACLLKGRQEFAELGGYAAAQLVDSRLRQMYPAADDHWIAVGLPNWDSFEKEADPYDAFIEAWDRIETPMRLEGPSLQTAVELADRYPMRSSRYTNLRDQNYLRLLSVAFWLSYQHEGGPFPLSCRKAGEILGITYRGANGLIRRAQTDGLLILEKASTSHHSANEFRFRRELVQSAI